MTAFVMRILSGLQAGAEQSISGPTSFGHDFWHDIVIRDPAARGLAGTIAPDGPGCARLTLTAGQLSLCGASVLVGQPVLLPFHVPVRCGGLAFAVGIADSPRWAETAAWPAGEPVTAAATPPMPWWRRPLGRPGRRIARLARGTAAVAAALAVGAIAMGPDGVAAGRASPDAERTRAAAALAAAGYPALSVRAMADGSLTVTGTIASEADRPAVAYALAAADVPATLALRSASEIARAVADTARIHGIAATARPAPGGGIEVHTPATDAVTRARLLTLVRRDVPGAGPVNLVADTASAERSEAPALAVADVTKRVSTVVAGAPAYIVTADGAHYFPGAMLPSGHRLISIAETGVVVEQAGTRTRLTF